MTKFIQPGKILDFVAGAGGVAVNVPLLVNGYFVVPQADAAEGETYSGAVEGVFEFPAATHATTQAGAQGVAAYWDATNKRITVTATDNTKVGIFAAAKASLSAVASVYIRPTI